MVSPAGKNKGLPSILGTHSRYPYSKRDDAYTYSYRIIRLVVGFLGILLPVIFIIGEAAFLKGGVQVRGSLSAYYHSPMQDFFVGGLCITGLMLATYMGGEPKPGIFGSASSRALRSLESSSSRPPARPIRQAQESAEALKRSGAPSLSQRSVSIRQR